MQRKNEEEKRMRESLRKEQNSNKQRGEVEHKISGRPEVKEQDNEEAPQVKVISQEVKFNWQNIHISLFTKAIQIKSVV
jgi:hypothetical protein